MRKFLIALIVASSVACSSGAVTGSSTITGTYRLRSINGAVLPYTTSTSGGATTEIVDDQITFDQSSTYSESGHTRTTANSQVTVSTNSQSGSYTLQGNAISLAAANGGSGRSGTIINDRITFVEGGLTSVFTK